jgi:hypothetical protein
MLHRSTKLTRIFALAVALVATFASGVHASVQTYKVGPLGPLGAEHGFFSASWLHDATSSPSSGPSGSGLSDNRAYRMGEISSLMTGSIYGDFDAAENVLGGIGGTITGKTLYLLDDFKSSFNGKEFALKLGKDAGAGKSGALKFKTDGVASGQYSGGFIDFLLSVEGESALSGTFFFKPQAESGGTMPSPNRGDAASFTLWGNNWMHDSEPFGGGPAVGWTAFLASLGYSGNNVLRPDIVAGEANQTNHTLGISLFVTASHSPEPTTFIVWGLLSMIGVGYSRRVR